MGAMTWMLIYSAGDASTALRSKPPLNREASEALATKLFPSAKLKPIADGDLSYTNPPEDEVFVGCFAGVSVVAATELADDHPSEIPQRFLQQAPESFVYLHAMHSAVDWFAYAVWKDGQLQRSLSVSPDGGVIEDIGARLPFEEPYWAGAHPATDPGRRRRHISSSLPSA